jgi:hypothetical protein
MLNEEDNDEYTEGFNKELQVENPARAKRVYRDTASSKANGVDPKAVRIWADANGIALPARGRFPAAVVRQYINQS